MKQTLMLLLYVHIYSMQCRLEEGEGCGEGCSVVKEVLFTNNLLVRFSESWFCCSLVNPTKPPFFDVIILILEILVSSKEYAFSRGYSVLFASTARRHVTRRDPLQLIQEMLLHDFTINFIAKIPEVNN